MVDLLHHHNTNNIRRKTVRSGLMQGCAINVRFYFTEIKISLKNFCKQNNYLAHLKELVGLVN